jgi:transposase-like protein
VEADETFVGGLAANMHNSVRRQRITSRGGDDKAVVQGVIQRGGRVRAKTVEATTKLRLQGNVRRWVKEGSAVYTDEAMAYKGLDRHFAHKSVDHSREYVSGDVHTNTLESFWALLKERSRAPRSMWTRKTLTAI